MISITRPTTASSSSSSKPETSPAISSHSPSSSTLSIQKHKPPSGRTPDGRNENRSRVEINFGSQYQRQQAKAMVETKDATVGDRIAVAAAHESNLRRDGKNLKIWDPSRVQRKRESFTMEDPRSRVFFFFFGVVTPKEKSPIKREKTPPF
ncbi:hypothetical protein EUGRSUZ_C02073 [Eucalyptus grandis]|uniref:Uncharacterized protein n=2 Tax=Eucalyptus grandis TaxID=71139 RepID=A0ACC3LF43_EUCGR|nr:hypothetical protein EUGRSUZ_C02073 [Eucalyptus grandis]